MSCSLSYMIINIAHVVFGKVNKRLLLSQTDVVSVTFFLSRQSHTFIGTE